MVKKFNEEDFIFYNKVQLFMWRCWGVYRKDKDSSVNEKLNTMSTWFLELFPEVMNSRIQILDDNFLEIPLNRCDETNHHIVYMSIQHTNRLEVVLLRFDLRENPNEHQLTNICWVDEISDRPKYAYKKTPKVF